ncbi:ABC transporter ATP-binding protein [Mesorhizobium sp.]|uniref:ABC transporter ATP-binding protein n=1 Tax=Mesorhizobium sp. TaxID=1871066 RepID=UPI000FE48E94|nr:ABC transporter ATP-binding protein [Mesorhizobium sp.]RWK43422.1 MAG: ABC transporter ATP-binding protein [Mesorhizobium sp.]RWK69946.1 MAG: ABC transporter ATP-binding protein [Mesorhizobium sp.]RWK77145.1 MAG: ABC transporter ATP-binding protein [Mesorhizobium sp.]RWK80131.1 MAG: ABC transporter ATP-binding protein [Mesorhizobium sp.]RWL01433.1 MAG: ABC transporter ATP-binding protein [Mesorhizobium sp.]
MVVDRQPLLEVHDLRVTLRNGLEVIRGVDFVAEAGKVLGIVGESGSGKSIMMRAALGLSPSLSTVTGSIKLRGEELVGANERRMRELRGSRIGLVFQDPMTALNPVITVGKLIAEAVRLHKPHMSAAEARRRSIELLELVAVPQPEVRANQYVHEFSGGMKQRAMIAIAIANNPEVLIADEPTTALDVTVQAQILEVLKNLQSRFSIGLVLITHDLGVVAGAADTVVVMYAGKVMETGAVRDIFYHSRHPYTRGLLSCLPTISGNQSRLEPISGSPPLLSARPAGCPFHPRCSMAQDVCRTEEPILRKVDRAMTACHFAEALRGGAVGKMASQGGRA